MKTMSFSFDSPRTGRSLAAALFVAGLQLLVAFPNGNLRAGGVNEEGQFFRKINLENLEGLFENHKGHFFRWINLQSDIAGVADRTDVNLVNPWGLAISPTGIFWVADNHTGVSTLYEPNGEPFPGPSPLVVTIPPSSGDTEGVAPPTGLVVNPFSNAFLLGDGKPALFIFDAEDGGVSAWNPGSNPVTKAVLVADTSKGGAVYKGLAIGNRSNGGPTLYATDFHNRKVDVFDSSFGLVVTGGFQPLGTPPIPSDFAPFGVANIDGFIYVTYAKQKPPDNADDLSGPGNGFINVFRTDGTFVRRLVSNDVLNSPWGLAKVPPGGFGEFGPHVLLVGNFGDGQINAFDIRSGASLGPLLHRKNQPLEFSGLWSLFFLHHRLYFTAGLADEEHGLFGFIRPSKEGDDNE
jgi:uncharacterized protein (TIGR03118 family)